MNPSKPAGRANKAYKDIEPAAPRSRFRPRFRLAIYPLLGILLVLFLAVLTYGGLLFLFLN